VIAVEAAGLTLGFIAVIGGLAIAALAIVVRSGHDRRKRELEHIERMTALQLGRSLPQDEPWLSPMKLGALIAMVVPVAVFVPAWLSTELAGYHETTWVAAAMVGLGAVLSGSILAGTSLAHQAKSAEPAVDKPYVEEDAYDVVSSRG